MSDPASPAAAERSFTAEQAHAIAERTGPMLLSANAGSGKTSVLTERFVAAVLEDGLEPGALLAITFTEKAAGELRARIRARFEERGARAAARDTEGAWISTIHGFCARVLRAHAVQAGLDPGFGVLDAATARLLRAAAFDHALAAFLAPEAGGDPRPAALDLAAAWGVDRLATAVGDVHDALRSAGRTVPVLPPPRPRRTVPEALARLDAARAALAAELQDARAVKSIDDARSTLETGRALVAAGGVPSRDALAALTIPRRVDELRTPACAEWHAARDGVLEALDDAEAVADHALLAELLASFAGAYAEAKRARSALDYDDLELLARDLLAGHPAVAVGYAERFARIMVDEFQDTNRLQLELLGHLDRGNVFLVGDELQSIYGFRHADVEVFRARRAAHAALGAAPVLATNWRSHPALLATVNGAFGAGVHAHFVPLVAGRADPEDGAPRTELLLTDAAWDDDDAVGAPLAQDVQAGMPAGVKRSRLAEARAVAHRVRALVDAGECREQDVVVLLRAASDLHVFERALERERFVTLASGGRGYWLRQQVQDLTAYLGALVNPLDAAALYGTLASPLCGLSSDGLAHVAAMARTAGSAWAALGSPDLPGRLSGADARRLDAFVPRFGAERAGAPARSLDELVERAVTQSGYDLHVLRLPGGRRRLANVHKLQRLAATFEAERGRDVRAFIDHARAEVEADAREPEAPVELGDEPAIRLMTVHAAKGLEFGVVVLADLGRGRPPSIPDVLVDGARVGLRLVRMEGKAAEALDYAALKAEAEAAAREEEQRIVHVALTRAEERLILSGVAAVGPEEEWPRAGGTASALSWMGPQVDPDLPARLADEPELVLDRTTPDGRVHVAVSLVAPATAPRALGLAAPPPPGAQLGLFGASTAPSRSPVTASAPSADAPLPAATPAADAALPTGAPAADALFAAGLTSALTDPAAGLDGDAPEGAAVPAFAALSYTALSAHARCGYRFYLERVLRLPEVEAAAGTREAAPGASGLDPRVRGSIAHLALEELDLAPGAPLPPPELLAAWGAQFGGEPTAAEAGEVHALLTGFVAASPVLDRLRGATRVRREAPFALPLSADPDAPLLTGVLDVLADERDGHVLVVDWKTDRVGDEAAERLVARSYATQRAVYALAVLASGAASVEVAYAFLERPAELVRATFGPADGDALRAALQAQATPVLAGAFAVADEPHLGLCGTCPGRGGLCSWPRAMTDRELGA